MTEPRLERAHLVAAVQRVRVAFALDPDRLAVDADFVEGRRPIAERDPRHVERQITEQRDPIHGARAHELLLRFLRHVVGWRLDAARTEQELFALLLEDFVRLLRREIEAVLVDDPLGVLDPVLPGLGRDVVVDALAQGIVERLVGEARKLLAEFCALDHTAHVGVLSTKPHQTGPTTR